MSIIELESVCKCFSLQEDRPRSFQELVLNGLTRRSPRHSRETLWALRHISFKVSRGETLAIIGSNGSGKSTCLKLLTQIFPPTSGSISVCGRVSALLELGAGFHPDLTGRDNIYLYGSVLGVGRREMTRRFDDIVEFAELERFIDVPCKFYSSGMYVRLAFATAISVDPEILLIDEVLAVGDESFQEKCLRRIHQLKNRGVTIVFVSHSLGTVEELCDRAIWLDRGELREDGPSSSVVAHYLDHVHQSDSLDSLSHSAAPIAPGAESAPSETTAVTSTVSACEEDGDAPDGALSPPSEGVDQSAGTASAIGGPSRGRQWGTGEVDITDVRFLDIQGNATDALETGRSAIIAIHYQAHRRIEHPVFGVAVHDAQGACLSGCNTHLAGVPLSPIDGEGVIRYQIASLPLGAGDYLLSAAIHNPDETETYDFREAYYPFRVTLAGTTEHVGAIYIEAQWEQEARDAVADPAPDERSHGACSPD